MGSTNAPPHTHVNVEDSSPQNLCECEDRESLYLSQDQSAEIGMEFVKCSFSALHHSCGLYERQLFGNNATEMISSALQSLIGTFTRNSQFPGTYNNIKICPTRKTSMISQSDEWQAKTSDQIEIKGSKVARMMSVRCVHSLKSAMFLKAGSNQVGWRRKLLSSSDAIFALDVFMSQMRPSSAFTLRFVCRWLKFIAATAESRNNRKLNNLSGTTRERSVW